MDGGILDNDTFLELESRPLLSNNSLTFKRPPVARCYYTDYTESKVILVDSNAANATYRFVPGSKI